MNLTYPTVTIITPTKNQGDFIEETVNSILKQSYKKIQYKIINGESTDNTENILLKYSRLNWETIPSLKQAGAINKGWKDLPADIYAFLNSDDIYLHDHVICQAVEYLKNNPEIGIVFGRTVYTNEKGKIIGEYNTYPFEYDDVINFCKNPIAQPAAFIRREVIQKIGYLDESLNHAIDLDFWLRAALYFKIDYVPEVWATFRLHSNSKSVNGFCKWAENIIYIYNKLYEIKEFQQLFAKNKQKIMSRAYFTSANLYFSGGRMDLSRKYFLKSMRSTVRDFYFKHFIKLLFSCIPYSNQLYRFLN
jgi:glycosyltransferase involved in cell wall biosynthesis